MVIFFPSSLCCVVFWHFNVRDFGVKRRKERRKEEKCQVCTVNRVISLVPRRLTIPCNCRHRDLRWYVDSRGCFKEEAASGRRAGEREEERLGQGGGRFTERGEETFVDDLYAFHLLFPLWILVKALKIGWFDSFDAWMKLVGFYNGILWWNLGFAIWAFPLWNFVSRVVMNGFLWFLPWKVDDYDFLVFIYFEEFFVACGGTGCGSHFGPFLVALFSVFRSRLVQHAELFRYVDFDQISL